MMEHQKRYLKLAKDQWEEVFGVTDSVDDRREIRLWAQYLLDYDRKIDKHLIH